MEIFLFLIIGLASLGLGIGLMFLIIWLFVRFLDYIDEIYYKDEE